MAYERNIAGTYKLKQRKKVPKGPIIQIGYIYSFKENLKERLGMIVEIQEDEVILRLQDSSLKKVLKKNIKLVG